MEKIVQTGPFTVQRMIRPASAPRGVHRWEIKLFVRRTKVGEKVKTLIQRAVRFAIGLVDLVDHNDRTQAQLQGLGCHEFSLGHRAFGRIYQQHNTVHHRQDTLDLAAEIGVAGGVNDVDACAFPNNGGRLGKDRDAAFALQIVAVHGALGGRLVFPVGTGLFQKLVNQRRLAVVNVSDDCDIAQVHGFSLCQGVGLRLPCMRSKGQTKSRASASRSLKRGGSQEYRR